MPKNHHLDNLQQYRRAIGNQSKNLLKMPVRPLKNQGADTAAFNFPSSFRKFSKLDDPSKIDNKYRRLIINSNTFNDDLMFHARINPRFVFFLFMALLIPVATGQSLQEKQKDGKCLNYPVPDPNEGYDHYYKDPCIPYCEHGFTDVEHRQICYMMLDQKISLQEVLALSSEQTSRLPAIHERISLSALVIHKLIPIVHLLSLPTEIFDYFANYYHHRVIGLSELIHKGLLSYDKAVTMIQEGMPYQLSNVIVHSFILEDQLSIDVAVRIDSATMSKLAQYPYKIVRWEQPGIADPEILRLRRAICEAGFKLTDFIKYPATFIYQVVHEFELIRGIRDKSLTLETCAKIPRFAKDRFLSKWWQGPNGQPPRLLDLVIKKIIDVDFLAGLTEAQGNRLNICANFINEGLPVSEVLAVPGRHFVEFANTRSLYKLVQMKKMTFSTAIELIRSNRYQYFKSSILGELFASDKISIEELSALDQQSIDFLVDLDYSIEQFETAMSLVTKKPTLEAHKALRGELPRNDFICTYFSFFLSEDQCKEKLDYRGALICS